MSGLVAMSNAGRYVELESRARELLIEHQDSGFVWKVLGVALCMQGKEALKALQRAATLLPSDAEVHSNLGSHLLDLGRPAEAAASCRRALQIKPHLAQAHNNLGNALRATGLLGEAVASYRRALQIDPDFAQAHNNLGNALRGLGQLEEAVPSLRRAVQIKPQFAEAHNNLGNALRDLLQSQAAVTCYSRALEISPGFAEAHSNLGNALLDLGRLEDATASYRRAVEIQPRYAEGHNNLGNALRALGRLDEAVTSCRRALQINTQFAEAHNNLGNALREQRQLHDAVASYRRAIDINPDFAEAHCNLGSALLDLWQLDYALASYRRALQLKPDYAEAHAKLGNVLMHLWRLDEAVASCRQALALKPDYAEAHHHLGNALLDLGQFDDAQGCYRRALMLKPDFAELHNSLAAALRLQGRAAEAEVSCRRALELKPDLAAALTLLAELRSDQGRFAEAEQLYRRAAVLEPRLPAAWANIARLRTMTAADAPWLIEAQRATDAGLAPRQEVHLRYAMGKYCDDLQDFERAFCNYQRANELTRLHRPKHERTLLSRAVDRITQSYDKEWLRQTRIDPIASSLPVFVVGMPRSGTTLAEQILASHPSVFGAGELPFWSDASSAQDASAGTPAHEYLRLLGELSPGALRVVDKMPGNFLRLGLIHAALPNARIVHMRRNPMDTCLSIYFQDFAAAHSYANDLEDLACTYSEYWRLMKHWQSTLPRQVLLDVSYEGLVTDQEGWSRKMLEFIGLPWDSRCLDFQQTDRTVITASKWQVRQKISNSSVARWRNYEKFIAPLLSLTELIGADPATAD